MIDFIGNDIEKNTLYKNEIPYRMVCNMIKMYWPHQYKEELRKYGLMLIKPEAIIMGKASEIFSILHSSGYELIYFVRKKIDALRTSEMWKFSWVNSSLEHILVNQKLFSTYDSLILILCLQSSNSKSACQMLTDLKGSAFKSEREPHQIRWKIRPINYMLNYVHTSDDSNDFMREIGILLDWEELLQVFKAIASNHTIVDCQHFFRQIFLGYFSDIVQAFDALRKNVCGDDYTSLHNPIVLSSVLPAYGMFHSIQILFL